MIIIDLMLVALIIITITLLSGAKIMYNQRYLQVITFIVIMYTPLLKLVEGYKLRYIGISTIIAFCIVMLLIFIWGYRKNKYRYSVHNVKEKDVINIIESYLDRKNLKYEVINDEIHLLDIDNNIYVRSLMEITLDCREIKNTDYCNEIIDEVKMGIKEINQRYFSIEGMFYLVLTLFFFWVRFNFLMINY
ncbi:hypothetical protein [Romboutsia ilealis]|uniref:hypothetical protein n=2 Tax=Romboutsia ilealis TaxID=1115758 RepID=UPI0025B7796C|nr:hypothetical protein [Romboutsia ilealis]